MSLSTRLALASRMVAELGDLQDAVIPTGFNDSDVAFQLVVRADIPADDQADVEQAIWDALDAGTQTWSARNVLSGRYDGEEVRATSAVDNPMPARPVRVIGRHLAVVAP
jgi:hypothetical protein